ncbi:MAG TPA: hypothetical protein VF609_11820 [Flavisolibacter sp.]
MEEFPLRWPLGYPVTENPEPNYNFNQWTLAAARKELLTELNRLKPESFVITRNNDKRKDGLTYSADNLNKIPKGVAVYFTIEGEQKVLCCDMWDNWGDNMRALTLTINALRGLERWGCSNIMKGAFSGLKELPYQTDAGDKVWQVLHLSAKPASWAVVEGAYKSLAKQYHPDIPGGSSDKFSELQEAFQKAKQIFGV